MFLTPGEEETITWLFTRIHSELKQHGERTNTDIVLSLLSVVLTYAETYYARQFNDKGITHRSITNKVKGLLQDHYQNLSQPVSGIPTVSALAARLNVSPNYLTDLVREETGKSTIALIHDYVIGQAEILLQQTSMNVSDVAYQVGFDNVPYFSRLFKKVRGISPAESRNQGNG